MHRVETVQSTVSYGTAAGGIAAVNFLDSMAGMAESITLIVACTAVVARALYDIIRLVRLIKNKKEK